MTIGSASIGEVAIGEEAGAGGAPPGYAASYELNNAMTIADSQILGDAYYYTTVASLTVSEAQEFSSAYMAKASINVWTNYTQIATGLSSISESLSVAGKAAILFDAIGADILTITPDNAYTEALRIAELLQITGIVDTHLQALQLVAQAIAMEDSAGNVFQHNMANTMTLAGEILGNIIAYELALEDTTVTGEQINTMTVYANGEEAIDLTDDAAYYQRLVALIAEGLAVTLSIRLGNDVYAAWLVNPATAGASRYDNFPFNSMAEVYGKYYAAADDGIYVMDGDDDAGTPISSLVKTGLSNYGERKSKRINDVFIGVVTSGEMVLKVTADEVGARTEAWYKVVQHGDAANHRSKVGKGLSGIYWGFELVNVTGADFDLDNLQLYPLTLSRRV